MRNLAACIALVAFFAACTSGVQAQPSTNLITDCSFEAPTPSWFTENGQGGYFAGKARVKDATDGNYVLSVQGWEKTGSNILAPVITLPGEVFSGTVKWRSFGSTQDATLELALMNENGDTKLASFGIAKLDGKGQWNTLSAHGVKLAAPIPRGRPCLIITGPQRGLRLEIDEAGLFPGAALHPATDNADITSFEAEDMADGKGWRVQPHFATWYSGLPSGMKMLSGSSGVVATDNKPATKTLNIRQAGPHRLWALLFRTDPSNRASYTISIQQNDKTVASQEVDDGDSKIGSNETWVWVSMDADLAAGPAQITVTRPSSEASWVSRKIDMFVLTSMMDYKPKQQDFQEKGYFRFTNLSDNQEPFCLMSMVVHYQGPVYYVMPGMLSHAGLSQSCYVPHIYDPQNGIDKWLAKGDTSPWVRISDFLEPAGNRIGITATRRMHTEGFVEGNWKGTLEFAVGDDHRIVKTIHVDQTGPRLLMTLPNDFSAKPEEILTSWDYETKTEQAIAKAGSQRGPVAKHLDLNVIMGLDRKTDDIRLYNAELSNIKKMGFNGTYTPLVDAKDAVAFNTANGLELHFGMWVDAFGLVKNGCYNQPDTEAMDKLFKQQAELYAPIVNKVERMKMSDEPGAQPYQHYADCAFCKEKFKSDLKAQGFTPQQLGVTSWDEVQPVMPQDKEKHPELFYYTGLFRIQSFANQAHACIAAKNKYLPTNVKGYVNYSPPTADALTWEQRGNDLFLCHRNGGLEMGWTEDWLGYSGGPQTMSPLYSQLRSAGSPTNMPLGGYMVNVSGGAILQRLKYYGLVAAGARNINVYNYGPFYASVDSFSNNDAQYEPIIRAQHEFGVIDGALYGTVRRPAEVAIYYNRTAGIWVNTTTTEQDSRYLHYALAHAGYDADFVCDEDIAAGKLKKYKVLYIDGIQMLPVTASAIGQWVKGGGVLAGTVGVGTRDQYNRPMDLLNPVFGMSSSNLKEVQDAGRPKYETRWLKVLDELSTVPGSGAPQVTFNQLCTQETLALAADANVQVILKNKAGEPAGVLHTYGKGTAIRLAAAPGIAYYNEAVRDKDYSEESYLPRNYHVGLRDLIVWPAMLGKAFRVAHASTPITEITRYDGKTGNKARAVIFVVDYNAQKNQAFSMTLPQTAQFKKAYSATGNPVTLKRSGTDSLEVSFTLDSADAIVLE